MPSSRSSPATVAAQSPPTSPRSSLAFLHGGPLGRRCERSPHGHRLAQPISFFASDELLFWGAALPPPSWRGGRSGVPNPNTTGIIPGGGLLACQPDQTYPGARPAVPANCCKTRELGGTRLRRWLAAADRMNLTWLMPAKGGRTCPVRSTSLGLVPTSASRCARSRSRAATRPFASTTRADRTPIPAPTSI